MQIERSREKPVHAIVITLWQISEVSTWYSSHHFRFVFSFVREFMIKKVRIHNETKLYYRMNAIAPCWPYSNQWTYHLFILIMKAIFGIAQTLGTYIWQIVYSTYSGSEWSMSNYCINKSSEGMMYIHSGKTWSWRYIDSVYKTCWECLPGHII